MWKYKGESLGDCEYNILCQRQCNFPDDWEYDRWEDSKFNNRGNKGQNLGYWDFDIWEHIPNYNKYLSPNLPNIIIPKTRNIAFYYFLIVFILLIIFYLFYIFHYNTRFYYFYYFLIFQFFIFYFILVNMGKIFIFRNFFLIVV